jgi:antitoxin component of MazEF toxin-antitoxin module
MSRDELSFPAQIKKLGNSYCIPLSKSMARILGVEEGDDVDVTVKAVRRQGPRGPRRSEIAPGQKLGTTPGDTPRGVRG